MKRIPSNPDLGLLLLRLSAGLMMAFSHGLGKMPPSDRFLQGVEALGFPLPGLFAWAAAGAELLGGLLIAVGLLARPAAVFLAITMAVAAFGAHAADPFSKKEMALLYLAISLTVAIAGAGRYSLDAKIFKRR
jgi:putative oxidoreductase